MTEQSPTKDELADQVKRLQDKLRELGDHADATAAGEHPARRRDDAPAATGGLAGGVLTALGQMVPGLQTLVDVAAKMPEVRDRLASIDEEIKRKFRDHPLPQESAGLMGPVASRRMGIPPSVRRGRSTSSSGGAGGVGGAGGQRSAGTKGSRGRRQDSKAPRIHISPETPAQLPVDVFDEGDHLAVLAEAPGLELKDIRLSLDGTVLVIVVDAPSRQGTQRVELPCPVRGKPKATLAKGVLHIHLRKATET
jgi:HSP20 family molecular chaperone IbpA